MRRYLPLAASLLVALTVLADGPQDNIPDKVRPIPPQGIAVPSETQSSLLDEANKLDADLLPVVRALREKKSSLADLGDDVAITSHAVRVALTHNEIFDAKELKSAEAILKMGRERLEQLRQGKAPWTSATGPIIRAYRSKIDGSLQPYGLVVPASYNPALPHRWRLDLWCHGRGEKLSELNFLADRMKNPGQFTPPHAIVLHLYGRYCNANKFAGEIDCLEALEAVQKHYAVDLNRRVIRGFSMGGAACWQFAVHYPDLWAAAAPGAGFSETAEFLALFQNEKVEPTPWEKSLYHWYDCTDWAGNLFHVPTVAYSGEVDKQKQAADVMARACEGVGLRLTHLIGPKTGHSYHPDTKRELNERIDAIVARGRNPVPPLVKFTTYSLRYHRCYWVEVTGLAKHWEQATVEARLTEQGITATTKNVTSLRFRFGPGDAPIINDAAPSLVIDGTRLVGPQPNTDRSWEVYLEKTGSGWTRREGPEASKLAKKPGLCGPIDDAFLDGFLIVKPDAKGSSPAVDQWVNAEMTRAIKEWRRQFRGEPRIKEASQVTAEDLARYNLVLWGTPQSNSWIGKVMKGLPEMGGINPTWTEKELSLGKDQKYDASQTVPLLVYPNPLNRERYVVLNSGFTYREYDYLNNARQVPKLPDWAIVDVRTAPNARWPGKIVAADFFDETWKLR